MLIQALKKRNEGLELTEEEKALLSEFDSECQLLSATIERLKLEKENLETQNGNDSTLVKELTEKLENAGVKYANLENELSAKQTELTNTLKALEETTLTVDAKVKKAELDKEAEKLKLEKENQAKADKILADAKNKELETQKKIDELNEKIAKIEAEKLEAENSRKFIEDMTSIKNEKPYLENHISVLMQEVKEGKATTEEAMKTLSFMTKTLNHEEEMEKYKAKDNPSIIDTIKNDIKKDLPKNDGLTDEERKKKEMLEIIKKHSLI